MREILGTILGGLFILIIFFIFYFLARWTYYCLYLTPRGICLENASYIDSSTFKGFEDWRKAAKECDGLDDTKEFTLF